MKTKEEIVANWLPRYTKRNLEDFGEYIRHCGLSFSVFMREVTNGLKRLGKIRTSETYTCLLYTSL